MPAGRPLGSKTRNPTNQKLFSDMLRIELAAAGDNHKALRAIARNLIELAQKPELAALPAINTVADRLDGKPAQESTVTIDHKRDATDWTREELVAFLNDARNGGRGNDPKGGRSDGADSVH
jgi:hypothetical protein